MGAFFRPVARCTEGEGCTTKRRIRSDLRNLSQLRRCAELIIRYAAIVSASEWKEGPWICEGCRQRILGVCKPPEIQIRYRKSAIEYDVGGSDFWVKARCLGCGRYNIRRVRNGKS
jgi:hypothetical protein